MRRVHQINTFPLGYTIQNYTIQSPLYQLLTFLHKHSILQINHLHLLSLHRDTYDFTIIYPAKDYMGLSRVI